MRYMMFIKGDDQSEAGVLPSEKLVAAMIKYNQELIDSGAMLAGEGLHPRAKGARVRFHNGKPTVIDGPFIEAKEVVAGYWIIQANSKEEAVEWAKRVPFEAAEDTSPTEGTGEVEIRPLYELEDFPVSENESGWREAEAEQRAQTPAAPHARPGLKQFMIFRLADPETEAEGNPMPSEELLTAMGAYNDELIRAGLMLAGEGLKPSSQGARVQYHKGRRQVIDGPFPETKELVAGFSVLQAKSLDEVIDWAKRWPPLDGHGNVELEIRQVFTSDEFGEELSPELRAAEERQRSQIDRRS